MLTLARVTLCWALSIGEVTVALLSAFKTMLHPLGSRSGFWTQPEAPSTYSNLEKPAGAVLLQLAVDFEK